MKIGKLKGVEINVKSIRLKKLNKINEAYFKHTNLVSKLIACKMGSGYRFIELNEGSLFNIYLSLVNFINC